MKSKELDIDAIGVPDVRVTATFKPELEEELRTSIEKMGVLNPISVILEGKRYVLVDGLHRLMACKTLKKKKIPAVVLEGKMKDNLLMNMVMNRMRGSNEPSQLIKVILALKTDYRMSYKKIEEATGLSKGYISQLIKVAESGEDLRRMVDTGEIDVQRAYQVAKVEDPAAQSFVAEQVVRLKMSRDETKAFVKSAQAEMAKPEKERRPLAEIPMATCECRICSGQFRPGEMVSAICCQECWGSALALTKAAMAGGGPALEQPPQE